MSHTTLKMKNTINSFFMRSLVSASFFARSYSPLNHQFAQIQTLPDAAVDIPQEECPNAAPKPNNGPHPLNPNYPALMSAILTSLLHSLLTRQIPPAAQAI